MEAIINDASVERLLPAVEIKIPQLHSRAAALSSSLASQGKPARLTQRWTKSERKSDGQASDSTKRPKDGLENSQCKLTA